MLLKLGSTEESNVKLLQEKLGGLTPDGDFGGNTEKAVKSWQTKNGLSPTGIVDDVMWNKLFTPSKLDITKLKGHVPDVIISQIPMVMEKFQINTALRLSHFLSQTSHESGGFKVFSENLYYSADGLKKIFPKYFPGNLSESYAKKPEMIASRVYGGRMGNGIESTKEGYVFRGRGAIQLTGKSNYSEFDKFVDEDIISNPDLVSTKYPLLSAGWFFHKNNLNLISDLGSGDDVVTKVTKRVNGGTIGLDDRIKHFKEFYTLLK